MRIQINLKIKPQTKTNQIVLVRVQDPQPGPHATTCPNCSQAHFAAFPLKDSPEYNAFIQAIKASAKREMQIVGMLDPISGPVKLEVKVITSRPETHYNSHNQVIPAKLELWPSSSRPALPRINESIISALKQVAFNSPRQIVSNPATREYGREDSIQITVGDYAGENQPELF